MSSIDSPLLILPSSLFSRSDCCWFARCIDSSVLTVRPFRLLAGGGEGSVRQTSPVYQRRDKAQQRSKPAHHTPLLPLVCMQGGASNGGSGTANDAESSKLPPCTGASWLRVSGRSGWPRPRIGARCILSSVDVCVHIVWLPSAASVRQRCSPSAEPRSNQRDPSNPTAAQRRRCSLLGSPLICSWISERNNSGNER